MLAVGFLRGEGKLPWFCPSQMFQLVSKHLADVLSPFTCDSTDFIIIPKIHEQLQKCPTTRRSYIEHLGEYRKGEMRPSRKAMQTFKTLPHLCKHGHTQGLFTKKEKQRAARDKMYSTYLYLPSYIGQFPNRRKIRFKKEKKKEQLQALDYMHWTIVENWYPPKTTQDQMVPRIGYASIIGLFAFHLLDPLFIAYPHSLKSHTIV